MTGSIYEFSGLPALAQLMDWGPRPARRRRAVPLVGIIRNPRSHRNRGFAPELADCSNILTETPHTRAALGESLAGFARRGIDYLVVDGGDGTVRDVLTCGMPVFGSDWPQLIVLPKGKTNALAVDLGLPGTWTLAEALAAAQGGNVVQRQPLQITAWNRPEQRVLGFFMGAGAFTLGTDVGQEAHRRGAFNSFAVALIVLWGVIQAVFGRAGNPWRACTLMRFTDGETGADLPHSTVGDWRERYIAVITAFNRFPLGARPFGRDPAPGIKIGMIDWPVRWLMLLLPAMLFGLSAPWLARKGAIRAVADRLDMDLGGAFILDGEAFPAGRYDVSQGPAISFVVP